MQKFNISALFTLKYMLQSQKKTQECVTYLAV